MEGSGITWNWIKQLYSVQAVTFISLFLLFITSLALPYNFTNMVNSIPT